MALLTLLAFAGMMLQVNYPLDPGLKFDLSEVFCVAGGILLGPLAGLLIVLLKNAMHHQFVAAELIGHICNFWAVGTMTVVSALVIRLRGQRPDNLKILACGLAAGVLARAAVMVPVNLVAIQNYGMGASEAWRYTITTSLSFNLIQGLATSLIVWIALPAYRTCLRSNIYCALLLLLSPLLR